MYGKLSTYLHTYIVLLIFSFMPPFHSPKKTLFKTSFFFCMFQKTGYRKSRASIRYQWMRIEECSPGSLLQMHDSKERSSFIAGTYTFYLWTLCVFLWQISVFLEEFRGLISSMVFLFDRLFFFKKTTYIDEKMKETWASPIPCHWWIFYKRRWNLSKTNILPMV